MKKYALPSVLLIFVTALVTALLLKSPNGINLLPSAAVADERKETETVKVYPVRLPNALDFCGETVPLGDRDVQERLDRELLVNTYWQSQTLLILKEYNKLRPL